MGRLRFQARSAHGGALTRRQALLGGGLLFVSGCYGSFGLTDALYQWNGGLSQKWVRALVFLGLVLIPVYQLFLLADAIVLNTIEFWTGQHPVYSGTDFSQVGERRRIKDVGDGQTVTSEVTEDPSVVRHEHRRDGELLRVLYTRRVGEDEVQLLDEAMQVLTVARRQADGGVELRDAEGTPRSRLDAADLRRVEDRVREGGSVSRALRHALPHQGDDLRYAEAASRSL